MTEFSKIEFKFTVLVHPDFYHLMILLGSFAFSVSTDKLKIKFATTKQSENSAYMYSVRSVFNHPRKYMVM